MHFATLALAAMAGFAAASPKPQGVTASLAPSSTAAAVAATCTSTYNNGQPFNIGIVNQTMSVGLSRRLATPDTEPGHTLTLTLVDGTIKDQGGNVGYFASNGQFQFDPNMPQTGAAITTGFSACPNNTLALSNTIFYECLSGSFYNLYDRNIGSVCYPVNLSIVGGSVAVASSMASSTPSMSTVVAPVSSPTVTMTPTPAPVTSSVPTSVGTVAPAPVPSNATTSTPMPFNPNAASSVAVSSGVLAAALGFAVLLL